MKHYLAAITWRQPWYKFIFFNFSHLEYRLVAAPDIDAAGQMIRAVFRDEMKYKIRVLHTINIDDVGIRLPYEMTDDMKKVYDDAGKEEIRKRK